MVFRNECAIIYAGQNHKTGAVHISESEPLSCMEAENRKQ